MRKPKGFTVLSVMVVVLVSIGVMSYYDNISGAVADYKNNYFTSWTFVDEYIIQGNYSLYYHLNNIEQEKDIAPSDIYIKQAGALHEGITIEYFNKTIGEWLGQVMMGYSNIHYEAKRLETERSVTNIKEDMGMVDLEAFYQFYVAFQYDAMGNLEIQKFFGDDSLKMEALLADRSNQVRYAYTKSGYAIEPIRNMQYFYGVPRVIKNDDYFAGNLKQEESRGYMQIVKEMQMVPIFSIILIAALCPYRKIEELSWFQKLIRIPTEILMGVCMYGIIVQVINAGYLVEGYFQGKNYIFLGIYTDARTLDEGILWLLHFVQWFICFASVGIMIWLVKAMHEEDIFKFWAKHSLIGKGIKALRKRFEKTIQKLRRTNLAQLKKSAVLNYMVIFAMGMSMLCSLWFFGIIGVLIYSIVAYSILSSLLLSIKDDYEKLMEHTSHVAEGDLDTTMIQEDLGMFEPLKQHITKIQEDFKSSVEEEIRSQKFKTDLITNVSHDLKTPLTSIISYVDLLKQEKLEEETRKQYVDILERKAARLQVLIEDLFEMSKASSGNVKLEMEQVDVVALIKETLFELEDKVEASSITFRTSLPQEKVYLNLDSARTFRVFDNLIGNITKYGAPHTRAYIQVIEDEKEVRIEIKNVAREELDFDPELITDRFVRGDKSRHTEGSGLGLAIAKSFVELQNGQLNVTTDGDLFKVNITFLKETTE